MLEQVQHDKDGFMFRDREEAAGLLAVEIEKRIKERDFIVAAILRGGIVLGKVIADYFKVPLKPLVIRKMGAPSEKELAIGAVGPKKTIYWDEGLIKRLGVDEDYKSYIVKEKSSEQKRLEDVISGQGIPLDFKNKKVIVVDDGVATGTTVLCAQMFLKKEEAKSIILATPVIAKDTFSSINKYFDMIVTLSIVENFYSVGQFYEDFPQVEDDQVLKILKIFLTRS